MESIEVLLAIALIPPLLLLFFIWKVDKLEHEPVGTIVLVLVLGAVCAGLALVLEIAVDGPIASIFNDNYALYLVMDNFVGVALMEELSKMLVIMLVIWRHKQFNCKFDGIVYGAASSLGFAALENVKYTLAYGSGTGLVRAFTAIPGHFIFGVFMGAMIGIAKCAKYDGKQGKKNLFLLLAILVPTLLHGYYDYLLSVPTYMGDTEVLWIVYLVAILIAAIVVIIRTAKHDRYIDTTKGPNGEVLTTGTTPAAFATVGAQAYMPGAQVQQAQQVYVPQQQVQAAQVYTPQPQVQQVQQVYTPQPQVQQVYVPQQQAAQVYTPQQQMPVDNPDL